MTFLGNIKNYSGGHENGNDLTTKKDQSKRGKETETGQRERKADKGNQPDKDADTSKSRAERRRDEFGTKESWKEIYRLPLWLK